MSPANAEQLHSPESGVKKPEAPKSPERAEHKLRIPEIGEKLKIYDASGKEHAEVVVAADEKEGLIIVGHKTGGETRVREVMPGESNSRERAEELNEKLNKAFESAADSAVRALMLKGAAAERMRERLLKSRALTVAKAASADAPETTITGAIEAMAKEKKEAKETKLKAEMERGIQETRLEVLSKREEVARLRAEVQKAEKAENDAAFKKAKKAFDKASKSLHSQERALVQLEEYASPKEDVGEIADRTEGAAEIKPKPVYSEGVAEVGRGIDFAESRMRELDKILEKDPKNITALNEWNGLNQERTADRAVLESLRREEDKASESKKREEEKAQKEKEIEALRAETEAMDKKELAEARKQLKTAEKAGDDKKAEQLLARVHELEQPAEDTNEIKTLQKEITALEAEEKQLMEADWEGFNIISKGDEKPAAEVPEPEEPYLDEEILSRPPPVPEDEMQEVAAEAERKEKEQKLRDILANVKSNRREAPRPKAEKPKKEEKEEEIPVDTSEFEKPEPKAPTPKAEKPKEEEPSIVVSPEAYPEKKHTPGSEVEKIDVKEVVKRVAEQRLKKEEKEHGMMLEAASKGLDIPASKIERSMAAFKNAKLWEQFRKASDTIPEKKGTAKLAFWKKEKSERQKVWEEIQDAAKEAGVDLTKAGKKRAR